MKIEAETLGALERERERERERTLLEDVKNKYIVIEKYKCT